jgi:hypothetical protein
MIYKFRSQATGDVIMLERLGDRVLDLIGHARAAQGIIEPAAMPAAIAALEAAVRAEEAKAGRAAKASDDADADAEDRGDDVPLGSRVWPMVEMLKRAHEAGEPIVWGV